VLAAVGGLYFVWVPSHATRLAEIVGIGRGVDLNFYIWIVISLLLLLNLHLKLRAHMELITVLARELAIANARSHAESSTMCPGVRQGPPVIRQIPAVPLARRGDKLWTRQRSRLWRPYSSRGLRSDTHCARAFPLRVALGIANGSRINSKHRDSA
jgi:hypothetical protein